MIFLNVNYNLSSLVMVETSSEIGNFHGFHHVIPIFTAIFSSQPQASPAVPAVAEDCIDDRNITQKRDAALEKAKEIRADVP